MKCQKNRSCIKQNPNSLPDYRKKCTGCNKIGKDKKCPEYYSKYIVFVDGMDGDVYINGDRMLDAIAHAFKNGAISVIVKKMDR